MGNNVFFARTLSKVFSRGLPAVLGSGYEARDGQVEMAVEAARCFEEGKIAVFEAETGLGKSLAYLIPLLVYCKKTGSRAVISTYTRTLQRQLIEKDFPQAKRATGVDIEAATLLGRVNYACKLAIQDILERGGLDAASEGWLRMAYDDDKGEIENISWETAPEPRIRFAVASPPQETVCKGCPLREQCHLLRARKRAFSSQIAFVNHALLFSDLSTNSAILGPYDILVIDEAHHLHDVATDFFSLSFSPGAIKGSPGSLYENTYEEVIAYARDICAAERPESAAEITVLWKQFHASLETVHRAAADLFERLSRAALRFFQEGQSTTARVSPGSCLRYYEGSPFLYGTGGERDSIKEGLTQIVSVMERIVEIVSESPILSESGITGTLRALGDVTREKRDEFDFLLSAVDESYVFYAETTPAHGSVAAVSAAPIDMSAQLGTLLEERCRSTLLTSATLAVGGDFSYVLKQLGLCGSSRTETNQYQSPFDLERQRVVFLASFIPDPGADGYLEQAAETIACLTERISKKTLVLCTSVKQLKRLSDLLSSYSTVNSGILAQEEKTSRNELIEQFKNNRGKKVLLGLASFWEGVDFPGELLEIVFVVKMPFLVPTEPLSQAKAQKLREIGEDPFWDFVLPDAVLKLRQGFGRLIRTGSDRGAVIVLDSRLRDRAYGKYVLEAVSSRVTQCDDMEELVETVRRVFEPGQTR